MIDPADMEHCRAAIRAGSLSFHTASRLLPARVLAEASALYAHATDVVAALPLSCRSGIEAARRIHAAIGSDLAAHGHDSITRRAHTTSRSKLALLLQSGLSVAAMSLLPRAATLHGAPRPEVAFLVEAAANPRRAPGRSKAVLTVLAQLQAQDRARATGARWEPQRRNSVCTCGMSGYLFGDGAAMEDHRWTGRCF